MSDGRWATGTDRCDWSDLPADQCEHCGAAPGSALLLDAPKPMRHATVAADDRTLEQPKLPSTWSEAAEAGECRCGRPTRDQAFLCDPCVTRFAATLADLAQLDAELEVTITRQRASATNGGPSSTETSLPWHERAGDARRALHGLLVLWTRYCTEENTRGPLIAQPHDTIASLAAWLTTRLPGLAFDDTAPDAMDEITDAAADCHRIVFWKRKNRIYLGPCGNTDVFDDDGNQLEPGEPCPGEVYAEENEPVGYCDLCKAPATVAVKRTALENDLHLHLATAAEIARLATYLGLDAPRDRVRKRVLYWHRHKRIEQRGADRDGSPMFRYGDVRSMLYSEFGKAAS